MTLSEFDRRCRGYHRREVEKYRRLRLVLAEIRNGLRGADQPAQEPADLLPLPGDKAAQASPQLSDKEYLAELARVAALDADLL